MSKAVECDGCGKLVSWGNAIRIENLDIPTAEDTATGWSGIDICRECLDRPMGEVLKAACNEIEEHVLFGGTSE